MKKTAHILFFLLLLTVTVRGIAPQKYIVPAPLQMLQCSKNVMLAEVGTKERTGRNDGPKIAKYLKSVDVNFSAPYCAAFVYYCFDSVVADKSLIPIKKTAVANAIYFDAKKRGQLVEYKAQVHDLIVWKRTNSWSGHIERVYEVHRFGWVYTVGANTSNGKSGSQREGNGVYKRRRNINHPIGRLQIRGLIGFTKKEIEI